MLQPGAPAARRPPAAFQLLFYGITRPDCRHSKAALVCKRWAAAVNSPELLESLSLPLGVGKDVFSSLSEAARTSWLAAGRRCNGCCVTPLR